MALLLAAPLWAAPADQDAAVQLEATLERLNALDEWFSEADRLRAQWQIKLRDQDQDIADLNQQVRGTNESLKTINQELKRLATDVKTLDANRREQAQRIATHVTAAHRLTGQDFMKQLLNQESPDTLDRMLRYHRYFSESRLEVVAEYRATLAELKDLNADLKAQRETQEQRREVLSAEQATLSEERAERGRMIANLARERETKSEEYERLTADRERLEALLAELRRRARDMDDGAFKAARGSLPMPVSGPVRSAFGSPRADNRLRLHGIDIEAAHGAPVTAVFRGRVIFSDWLRGFGYLTILDHGGGYMTLYGHVDVLHKKEGDWVESGELIAGAGNSGGSAFSGVYFEVRHNGKAQDPILWVDRS